jgi:hypothetical protein
MPKTERSLWTSLKQNLAHDPATGGVYLFDGASAIDLLGSKMCDLRPAIRWSGDLRSAPAALRDLSKELWFGAH